MAYAVVHFFPGGTQDQYEASVGAVHPSDWSLPAGQTFHPAGPSEGGWTILAVHESQESREKFRDEILMPTMGPGSTAASRHRPRRPGSTSTRSSRSDVTSCRVLLVRDVFLDPAAAEFFVDWEKASDDCVAFLRTEAGRDPYDKQPSDLIGELSTRIERFRQRWAAHDVRYHRTRTTHFHHPLVAAISLDYEAFELPGEEGQRLIVYTPAQDSPAGEALALRQLDPREPVRTTFEPHQSKA